MRVVSVCLHTANVSEGNIQRLRRNCVCWEFVDLEDVIVSRQFVYLCFKNYLGSNLTTSVDRDQPAHLRSLIWVNTVWL